MIHPRTLTEAIGRIADVVRTLGFADVVHGRVAHYDRQPVGADHAQLLPMVHVGGGEYFDCRPNDNHASVVFFASRETEKNDYNQASPFGHAQNHIARAMRPVTLYGWVDLNQKTAYDDGTGFSESVKVELKRALPAVRCITAITGYMDGTAGEVFKPFIVSDLDRKYDKWPYCCFRIELTILTVECRL